MIRAGLRENQRYHLTLRSRARLYIVPHRRNWERLFFRKLFCHSSVDQSGALSLVEIHRDTLLWLVEPKVYAITTHLKQYPDPSSESRTSSDPLCSRAPWEIVPIFLWTINPNYKFIILIRAVSALFWTNDAWCWYWAITIEGRIVFILPCSLSLSVCISALSPSLRLSGLILTFCKYF